MNILHFNTIDSMRQQSRAWHNARQTIGFVPTMGALHNGHLTLIKTAKAFCDKVVASVFVNPLQFAPHEDFDTYPRQPDHDAELLQTAGCDAVFFPERDELYPADFSTRIHVEDVAEPLEGTFRPDHFSGVATIVCKLLNIVQPTRAYFGEKDYQQLCVIQRFVRNLNMPVDIIGLPIIREEDGLALSSRNAYLTPAERAVAPKLYQTLLDCVSELQGSGSSHDILQRAAQRLQKAGFGKIDYLALCDKNNLQTLEKAGDNQARLLAAAYLGKTRLIDNIEI